MTDDNQNTSFFSSNVDGQQSADEQKTEQQLRPKNFNEFIGQGQIVKNVEIMIHSALKRKAAMDHCLLAGPPGLGKTSLAYLIADSLHSQAHILSAPAIEKKGDLAALLTNIQERDVIFIDEIHRLPTTVEEILYSAMEDFRLDILIGQGPMARSMQIKIPPFTLIGATTKAGFLSRPLRDRFLGHFSFDLYEPEELAKIIEMNAKKLALSLSAEAMLILARFSRGTPRIANRILRRLRDYLLYSSTNSTGLLENVGEEKVKSCLDFLGIGPYGLETMDKKILTVIDQSFKGGPVGIEAISSILGEDKHTIEDVYEPFLLKAGLLVRTPRGRMITGQGKAFLEEN